MTERTILSMDDANFAERFAEAIGLKPGETLVLRGPQFERTDGIEPIANPAQFFGLLHAMPEKTLRAIGMQPWNERLWLFPYQWFSSIPNGMLVESISGERLKWDRETCDDDMRFGALAYGIVPEFAKHRRTHD
jgi:hypothetical protein